MGGGQQAGRAGSAAGREAHPKCCTPIMGAAAATRSSAAAASHVCMPPSETPVMPMREASTSCLRQQHAATH